MATIDHTSIFAAIVWANFKVMNQILKPLKVESDGQIAVNFKGCPLKNGSFEDEEERLAIDFWPLNQLF